MGPFVNIILYIDASHVANLALVSYPLAPRELQAVTMSPKPKGAAAPDKASAPTPAKANASAPTPAKDSAPMGAVIDKPGRKMLLPQRGSHAALKSAKAGLEEVVDYVHGSLPELMAKNQSQFKQFGSEAIALHTHKPLVIEEDEDDGHNKLCSYQAPWSEEAASTAFKTTGRYQAGGNATWCAPFPHADDEICAGAPASWEDVYANQDIFKSAPRSVDGQAVAPTHSAQPAKEGRIVFPTMLVVWASTEDGFTAPESQPFSLRVLTGHGMIQGWYMEMYDAIEHCDVERVVLLWQAALTVTLHGRVLPRPADRAQASLDESNVYKTKSLACDSFPAASRKLDVMLRAEEGSQNEKLAKLTKRNVRVSGVPINKTMLAAIMSLCSHSNEDTWMLFYKFEQLAGKDSVTSKYQALRNLYGFCAKQEETWKSRRMTTADLVNHTLRYLVWYVERKPAERGRVTERWLCGAAGKPDKASIGQAPLVVATVAIMEHLVSYVEDLPQHHAKRVEVEAVADLFRSWETFGEAVAMAVADAAGSKYEQLCKRSGPMGKALASFYHDLFTGVYNDDMGEALAAKDRVDPAAVDWRSLTCELGTQIKQMSDKLGNHTHVVALCSDAKVTTGESRGLKRPLEEADDADPRASQRAVEKREVWGKVQAARRKIADL